MSLDVGPLREFAEGLMTDTCQILWDPDRSEGDTFDRDTGQLIESTPEQQFWTGPCAVRFLESTVERPDDQGGLDRAPARSQIRLPLSAPLPRRSMIVVVIAVGPDSDPTLIGRRFRVLTASSATIAVQRILLVEDA